MPTRQTQLVLQIRMFFVSLILTGIFGSSAFAHFVWIEGSPLVAPGKEEVVRFYFGEFHEFLREEAGGILDEREGLKVWIINSDGTISPEVGDEVVIQVLFKGQPLEKAKPFAYPPIGWIKGLRTNSRERLR